MKLSVARNPVIPICGSSKWRTHAGAAFLMNPAWPTDCQISAKIDPELHIAQPRLVIWPADPSTICPSKVRRQSIAVFCHDQSSFGRDSSDFYRQRLRVPV